MKLYATITSERGKPATKGGNEYIEMQLKAIDRNIPIGMISLRVDGNEWVLEWQGYNADTQEIAREKLSSELCKFCGKPADYINDEPKHIHDSVCKNWATD